ncbi:MAG: glycosyltransferase family 4 protein [Kofleriaceae bacterium]
MERLKIALACDWYAPQVGGIENHIRDLASALRARGHEPHVISSTPGPDQLDGVPVHRLDVARLPRWRVVADPQTVSRVRGLCERERFDVVHGHSFQSPLAHLAMYVSRGLAIPGVLTQHSMLGPRPTALLRWLDRRVGWSSWPTVITAVSRPAAQRARAAADRDVRVLHTGLDLSAWTRRQAASRGPLRVVCVTRLYAHKRTDELLRAIPRVLAASRHGHALRFVIVGDGPERRTLERLARRLGIAATTSFTGALARHEVARILERSHVFVLPNTDEAFGIAALEARALGLPVVARGASGACDLVAHERDGLLCETIDDMARAITRLCDDDVLRAALSSKARLGLERFDWTQAVDRHLAIYRQALARDEAAAAPRVQLRR